MGHYSRNLSFKRTDDDEVSIYRDGDLIGHIYKDESILRPGQHDYIIWLSEDYRGWKRITNRAGLRPATEHWVATHRYYG